MEIEGMIIRDLGQFDGISKAGNPWKKHEWVLETTGQYPRKVKFTVFGEKCNTITFELGKSYIIQVDVESREFNERWYTDVNAYAARPVEAAEGQAEGPRGAVDFGQPSFQNGGISAPATNPFDSQATDFTQSGDSQEDLPF